MKIYNKYLDKAVRTIDSVQPTSGFEKTKEFKKNLEIKKLEKQLGKKPTTQKLNKGGRVGLKGGSPMKEDRAREGKKAQYKKMGFGDLMKDGTIDFGDKHPILKAKKEKRKKYENPKKDERFNQAFKDRMKKAGFKDSEIGDSRLAKGGRVGLKRGGGKFPDHSGDGKITKKDILMAKGVIPKPKKSKSPMDKQVRKA
tara:strand:- start:24 stop:617 length:594 start_codon:yes stop_codon:yes gene_type:complete